MRAAARAEAVSGRAKGSSRPHRKMDLAPPATAYPAPEKGCPQLLPWITAGLDITETAALIVCAVCPDGGRMWSAACQSPATCLSSTWRRV